MSNPMEEKKREGPNFRMRLEDKEKVEWSEAAKEDGFDQLGSFVKWVMRDYLKRRIKKKAT